MPLQYKGSHIAAAAFIFYHFIAKWSCFNKYSTGLTKDWPCDEGQLRRMP